MHAGGDTLSALLSEMSVRPPGGKPSAGHTGDAAAGLADCGGGVAGALARFAGRRAAGALRFAGGRARVVAPARVRTIVLFSLSKPSA